MFHSLGAHRRKRRSTPEPPPPRPAVIIGRPLADATAPYPDGAWISRRDLLTIIGALDIAALYDSMHGTGTDFGRFKSLSRALGDDR